MSKLNPDLKEIRYDFGRRLFVGLKLRQAVADQYAALLALDQKAYGNRIVMG